MQIQLKQKEIEAALRGYIIKMGIRMDGRTLDISFVSGRKENGLTADLSIEDANIPGYNDNAHIEDLPPQDDEDDEGGTDTGEVPQGTPPTPALVPETKEKEEAKKVTPPVETDPADVPPKVSYFEQVKQVAEPIKEEQPEEPKKAVSLFS